MSQAGQAEQDASFYPLRVRELLRDTEDAVVLTFDVPPELGETFGFTQGQYLTLKQVIDGKPIRRS